MTWNSVTLHKLKLKSAPKANFPIAFEADSIYLYVDSLLDFTQKRVRIKRLQIDHALLGLELYNPPGSDNNWSRLLNNLSSNDDKYFRIDEFVFNHLQFQAIRSSGKTLTIPPITRLAFQNLGKAKPLTLSQLTKIVFEGILTSLTTKPYLSSLLDSVKCLPKELFEEAASTFDDKPDAPLYDSIEALKRKTQEAGVYIQTLFQ